MDRTPLFFTCFVVSLWVCGRLLWSRMGISRQSKMVRQKNYQESPRPEPTYTPGIFARLLMEPIVHARSLRTSTSLVAPVLVPQIFMLRRLQEYCNFTKKNTFMKYRSKYSWMFDDVQMSRLALTSFVRAMFETWYRETETWMFLAYTHPSLLSKHIYLWYPVWKHPASCSQDQRMPRLVGLIALSPFNCTGPIRICKQSLQTRWIVKKIAGCQGIEGEADSSGHYIKAVILGKLRIFEAIVRHERHYHCLQTIHVIESGAMSSSASIAVYTTQTSYPGCIMHTMHTRFMLFYHFLIHECVCDRTFVLELRNPKPQNKRCAHKQDS